MTTPDAAMPPPAPSPARRAGFGALARTMLVFLLVGPPVGGLVVMAALSLQVSRSDLEGGLWVFLFLVLWGWWFSYVWGAVPALASGLAIWAWRMWRGPASALVAGATGLAVGVVWAFGFMDLYHEEAEVLAGAVVVAGVVSTMLCWWLTGAAGAGGRR